MFIMADNDTSNISTPCSTVNTTKRERDFIIPCYQAYHYTLFAITLATFIYGVTSWCLIRKFRNFNNYVYLSATIVNIMRLALVSHVLTYCGERLSVVQLVNGYFFVFIFQSTVYNYWLVVMCYVYYVKLVKVFNGDIKRKYLKSTVFAWGMPIVVILICRLILVLIELIAVESDIRLMFLYVCVLLTCNLIPVVFNLIVFLKLLYSLFFSCKDVNVIAVSKTERRKERWRRLCLATSLFLLSNLFVLTYIIWDLLELSVVVRTVSFNVQILVITIFIPVVKGNRELWYEYYKNRLRRNTSL